MDAAPIPRYGDASLADVVPSVLAALGVSGFDNALGVEPVRRACLLLVDGLGWELARAHRDEAPVLARAMQDASPVTAGFPATTATSVASIGTGVPPGAHGIVGYAFAIPGSDHVLNSLTWSVYGRTRTTDLREAFSPELAQPEPTAFERAADAGLDVWMAAPPIQRGSGLTRAVLRGARFRAVHSLGDLEAEAADALSSSDRTFVYAYHADLDTTGHIRGTRSRAWRAHLAHVDRLVESLASRLGPDDALVVTADHGMVDLDPAELIDVDDEPGLLRGVRVLGGEARARHVYAHAGAAEDVLQAWRERLGEAAWVASRDEAIEQGWFGSRVPDVVRGRIGDVVTASRGPVGVVQRSVDPLQARFAGHHGSMTPREQLVPFVVLRP